MVSMVKNLFFCKNKKNEDNLDNNAIELAKLLSNGISGLECLYDANKLKFSFRCIIANLRFTLAMKNSPSTGEDMNEELGFDLINTDGDPFVELDAGGTQWFNAFSNPTVARIPPVPVPGAGIVTVNVPLSDDWVPLKAIIATALLLFDEL